MKNNYKKTLELEEWKDLEEAVDYKISRGGTIRNKINNRLSFGTVKNDGYLYHALRIQEEGKTKKKFFKTHTLVAKYFLHNPENKKYIIHKDGNKQNPECSNLEWVDELGEKTLSKGGYAVCEYDLDGNLIRIWKSCNMVGYVYPIAGRTVYGVCVGKGITAYGRQWKFYQETRGNPIPKLELKRWQEFSIEKKNFNHEIEVDEKYLYKEETRTKMEKMTLY